MMFQKEYKNAYDEIKAKPESIEQIFACAEGKEVVNKKRKRVWKPAIATIVLVLVLATGVNIPAIADEMAESAYESGLIDYTMYKFLQRESGTNGRYSYHFFAPKNATVSKDGVLMTVEDVTFKDNEMVMTVSFSNEEGSDFINGETEYHWNVKTKIADKSPEFDEMRVMKYDKEEGKLYVRYKAQRHTSKVYVGKTVKFSVDGMEIWDEWKEILDLTNVEKAVETRAVALPVAQFESDIVKTESEEYPYMVEVLNQTSLSEVNPKEMAVTGTAYIDGMLRVQICLGEDKVAGYDPGRNAYIFTQNKEGEEEEEHIPVSSEQIRWYEHIDGELVEFVEYYYELSEKQVKELSMGVAFWKCDGLTDTVWEVEFEIEE